LAAQEVFGLPSNAQQNTPNFFSKYNFKEIEIYGRYDYTLTLLCYKLICSTLALTCLPSGKQAYGEYLFVMHLTSPSG
tara:strand:+ start:100 stop:333 length:234 start_codon:yes stop_codon:yes gene_type:complete